MKEVSLSASVSNTENLVWATPANQPQLSSEGYEGAPSGMAAASGTTVPIASPIPLVQFDWAEPIPLPTGLAPVMPFDHNNLPDGIAPWVMDIADRMQCPPDFPAVAAIVALGSVLGRQIAIRPKTKDAWKEMPNLWGMVVGRPGMMKTPAMREALRPLKRLEVNARENFQNNLEKYVAELHIHKIRRGAADDQAKKVFKNNLSAIFDYNVPPEPKEPKPKRFIVSDATYEALGAILVDNPNGVLAFRDELVALLRTLDREEYAAARGLYLTAWSGNEGYQFDRIGRGHLQIDAVCISMLGSTQPGKLATYIGRAMNGGDGDDGLIQRFGVLVWPDQTGEWCNVDRLPDSAALNCANKWFEFLSKPDWNTVQPCFDSFDNGRYLGFDAEAAEIFIEWLDVLEKRLRSDTLHVAMESHLAKYRKLVPALALINRMASSSQGSVKAVDLRKAIRLATYLESHAHRAYGAGLRNDAVVAAAILGRIRKGELLNDFTLRDVHQRDWSNLTDREQI
ncbi:YfjI family protein [Methylobacterium isbiliense]|uniref:DUF3987 domain-containing protein n=1 Tax=Methylobacterium isbiliense TaxID=315478 RepID=A0ABQ4SK92_9HYPH|nr:YfjI family protein [Methylobacterium isbiliense]MDN3624479.1 YfjI family protein [Methylobacterium isbiliense]GJE02165.1 hypothetical protein GMJLKIPL_4109 [Methylobacterium isbiliense]